MLEVQGLLKLQSDTLSKKNVVEGLGGWTKRDGSQKERFSKINLFVISETSASRSLVKLFYTLTLGAQEKSLHQVYTE